MTNPELEGSGTGERPAAFEKNQRKECRARVGQACGGGGEREVCRSQTWQEGGWVHNQNAVPEHCERTGERPFPSQKEGGNDVTQRKAGSGSSEGET